MTRIKSKDHVKFFKEKTKMATMTEYLRPYAYVPTNERDIRSVKLRVLRDEACLYAQICSKLDILASPAVTQSKDPRSRRFPQERIDQSAK